MLVITEIRFVSHRLVRFILYDRVRGSWTLTHNLTSSDWEEPPEVVWESDQDPTWSAPKGVLPSMFYRVESLGKTQDTLEGLYLPFGLGMSRDLQNELEAVAWRESGLVFLDVVSVSQRSDGKIIWHYCCKKCLLEQKKRRKGRHLVDQ